jgi:hypothetical protein
MADVQRQPIPVPERPTNSMPMPVPMNSLSQRFQHHLGLGPFSPVNQNGSFESDRVLKSGALQKRTQKTKAWKSVFMVLRPNTLYIYKSDKEDRLRHKIYLSDLTDVVHLKDPKQKRHNVFGLFSPSRNFHLQASSAAEATSWVELIRNEARIDEEEEEMFLASPAVRRSSMMMRLPEDQLRHGGAPVRMMDETFALSSSPDVPPHPAGRLMASNSNIRRTSHTLESSGMSGNELASHSDFSDNEIQVHRLPEATIESLVEDPNETEAHQHRRPSISNRNASQTSGINLEADPDRVIWQGKVKFLRSKRGVRQWKTLWAVLRPRNMILYRDESEYTAQFIIPLPAVVNVVDIDPLSKSKVHCFQVITEEKGYKFCATSEESLVQCLGAFKSLLAKRRELEARAP